MDIKKLPENVKNLIQSGVVISDASQCILELIYNSLDANATAIAVRTDLKKFYVQVVDNGSGISPDDLRMLGDRHVTSKCRSLDELETHIITYGYRGIALASISDTCDRVEIQSRHSSSQSTFTRILKAGCSGEIYENQQIRPSHGTTVTVVNFMVSMPVRRKRVKEVFDLDFVVQQIEALSTIHYSVSFSLRNDTTGKVILQTYKQDNIYQSLSVHFGLEIEKKLIPISLKQELIEVTGFICRHLHTDCSLQFIYVNNRVIHNSKIHKLIVDLIKKYGNIWGKDKIIPDEVVDIEGFIYIVKIRSPYLNFTITRNSRKSIVDFKNQEDVLKCIIRAIKRRFNENNSETLSDISFYFDQPCQEKKIIGNPAFGPSQMNNVVCGRLATRHPETCVKPDIVLKENKDIDERIYDKSITSKCVATPPYSILQRYQREFFNENNNCSNLPDHVPIYEMRDFSHLSFHEFLAWLSLKAKCDSNALDLLSELTSVNFPNYNINKEAIVSLKNIRKEKLVASSRIMLKRIQEVRFLKTKQNVLENNANLSSKVFNSVTKTTYLTSKYRKFPINSCTPMGIKNSYELPQASFNEFLTWMRVKAQNSTKVKQFLSEFFSAKGYNNKITVPPQLSIKELRKEKLLKINNGLLNNIRCIAKERGNYINATSRKRCIQQSTNNNTKKKCGKIQETPRSAFIEKKSNCVNHDSSLVLTWKSHYRTDSVRLTKETLVHSPKNDSIRVCDQNISHCIMKHKDTNHIRPQASPVSYFCKEVIPYSPEQSFDISKMNQINEIPPSKIVKKIDFSMQTSPKIYHDLAIQTCTNVANISIQVGSEKLFVSSSTQTVEDKFGVDKEVQTTLLIKAVNEKNDDNIMTVTNASSSELPLPEVLKQSALDTPPSILRTSLADTVPINSEWEEKIDELGRKYFVHSSSGFSLFNPPVSSTRSSFPMYSDNTSTVLSNNFQEVQDVVTDSCQDDLSDVKWLEGNKDDVIDPILKMLQDASNETVLESKIMSAKIPREFMNGHKLLSSIVFSKDLLKLSKVIGQLDRKFIVAVVPKEEKCCLICVFDQHGVHERITLEKLLKKYQNDGQCETEALQTPINLSVPLSTYNVFLSEKHQFNKNGLYGVALDTSSINVTSVPSCFIRQYEREVKGYRKPSLMHKVANLIGELTDHLCETRGVGLTIPKTIMAVIASEACRSAIKFNQILTLEEMSKMINDLSFCNMPFQCAHGRPSVAPIFEMDYSVVSKNTTKLNFKRIKINKSSANATHGLN